MPRNILFAGIGVVVGFLAAALLFRVTEHRPPRLTTEYQLVLLTNGQTFIGKLDKLDSPYTVLRDVFYIQSSADPNTKTVKNSLIKRGKEWHEPDLMLLDARQITLIEPVKPSSTVARLIKEYKER